MRWDLSGSRWLNNFLRRGWGGPSSSTTRDVLVSHVTSVIVIQYGSLKGSLVTAAQILGQNFIWFIHTFFFSFVILFIYFKTSHFLLLEVFLWFLTALNHYWHQACRVYCTCTLYPVLNRSRTNGHMPSKHGNKQISLKSSLSLMSTIESRNGWKSEPMTEWNLYLCPWENISQCHFILMVCRAEVTSKLIYYVLQHKYLGWFWEEEEGRTD